MSTIDILLKSVAPDVVSPAPGVLDADLARGRAARVAARRRRAYRRAGAGALTLAAAAVAAVIMSTSAPSPSATSVHSGPVHGRVTPRSNRIPAGSKRASRSAAHIQLVAYNGAQLPGFTVTEIPRGWHLSTSTSTALLITPDDGSLNNDPDDFEGKLAVLPQSTDERGLGPGEPLTVNGRPGRVDSNGGGGVVILRYTTGNGHSIDIQAPDALHWSEAQLVAFAEGVTVTANVGTTHG